MGKVFSKQTKKGKKELKRMNQRAIKLWKEEHRRDDALRLLDRFIEQDSYYAPFHYTKGYILQSVRDFKQAGKCYSQALALDKDYADALSNRAICYKERGKLEKSLADLTRAIALFDAGSVGRVIARMNRGQVYDAMKRPADAVKDYTAHIRVRGPALPEALNNRALAYALLDRHDLALDDFNSAIGCTSAGGGARAVFFFNRAELLRAMDPGRHVAGIVRDYEQACKMEPKNPQFRARRAEFMKRVKKEGGGGGETAEEEPTASELEFPAKKKKAIKKKRGKKPASVIKV